MSFTSPSTFCYLSGDSTGLSGEGIAGRVLFILTEVITLLVWALFFAALAFFCAGKHLSVHLTTGVCDFLLCGRICKPLTFDSSVVF